MTRVADRTEEHAAHDAVRALLDPGAISIVFQPIVSLAGGSVLGYEALARFEGALPLRTDEWFDLAWQLGLGPELELACWAATAEAGEPPDGRLLFVNCRPELLFDGRARTAREALPAGLVLELSEQDEITDYGALRVVLDRWTATGDRVAIDDTGAGYASLLHVVQLEPDFLKLDRSLISEIDHDRNRRAMVCALVAYAQEAGAAVIAEGVERAEELAVLREVGVHAAQGYLLARPEAPWPATVWAPRLAAASGLDGGTARLETRLGAAGDVTEACDVTAEYLARTGELMPSIYLEREGLLRCQAHRGLWQILDGMPPEAGITGRAFREGRTIVVPDITVDDDYLEAIPGVSSEACAPLRVDGVVVGAVNVESFAPLPERALADLGRAAALLGERLRVVGVHPSRSLGGRLARHTSRLAGPLDESHLRHQVCLAGSELARMDSALLSLTSTGRQVWTTTTVGPLSSVLDDLDEDQHDRLAQLVENVASCYTAGDTTGACFEIARSLRSAGARSVVVLPLDARGQRLGFLLLAHTAPVKLVTDEVELLELLASHAGLCLETARLVEEYRRKASTDSLTGLGNHAAFRAALDEWCLADTPDTALLLADVDGFKKVNDQSGHLVGDQVLRGVADAMRLVVRPEDRLFRIGGDEFALLVTGGSSVEVGEIGRRVREAVEHHLAPHGAALSIGATVLLPEESAERLIERADRSLYAAKRGGGGQLRLAG